MLATTNLGSTVAVAVVAFISTNIDNLTLTTAQLATAPESRSRRILTGQVLGFIIVLAASVVAAAVLFEVPKGWIGLLGLVPLILGLRGLLALRDPARRAGNKWPMAAGAITAMLITIGSSGDNLAVYVPLFRASHVVDSVVILGVFGLLEVGLCMLARYAGRHPKTLQLLERGGVYLTPIVYCVIGVVVLVRSGSLAWI